MAADEEAGVAEVKTGIGLASVGIIVALLASLAEAAAGHNRPSYVGVRLGQSQDEVKYILGYPPEVVGDAISGDQYPGYPVFQTDGHDPKNAMPSGKDITDYAKWSYERTGGRLDLKFSTGGKSLEAISCYSNTYEMCPPLYGIRVGQTEASVIEALGSPESSSLDGVAYPAFGLDLMLSEGRVYMITLHQ